MKRLTEKKNIYIILSYIMLIGIIPATLIFSNDIGSRMDRHIIDTMENSADYCAEMIDA